jgi:hypothetical protein
MKTMYWVSNISSWNHIDIAGKTHGRIDWFADIRDMGYWWQTAYENGVCFTIETAKRQVEEALWRRCVALAELYDRSGTSPSATQDVEPMDPPARRATMMGMDG